MRLGIGMAIVLLTGIALQAQAPRVPSPLARAEVHEFTSSINGRTYRVFTALPEAYAKEAAARFPVVYVTDGNYLFGMTAQIYGVLRLSRDMPEAIIAAVSPAGVDERNPSLAVRQIDLTPTQVPDRERENEKTLGQPVPTGGAAAFLRVLREELIADMEKRYRTNGDRTYVGWSLGGLFGAYALFHAPDLFNRMVLVSPSLWWDGGIVAKYEEQYAAQHKSLPVRLFMSDGELESDSMIGSMKRLSQALERRRYEGLRVATRIFEGESHTSTVPVAVTRGLRTVFADETK